MKKFLSTHYSGGAFNLAMFLLRIVAGGLLLKHGYDKMVHFSEISAHFINFMGLGSKISLALVIFAEFFCSLMVIIGLFTRLACIPIVISTSVALFKAHNGDVFSPEGQLVSLFCVSFLVLLLVGAGRASVDSMISK